MDRYRQCRDAAGATRHGRYVCGTYWNRGKAVCGNGLMIDMPVADQAIRKLLATEVLRAAVVDRALDLALVAIEQERHDGSRARRLHDRLARLDVELAHLADTAARGGAVPAVLEALAARDAERRRLTTELAGAKRAVGRTVPPAEIRKRLRIFLHEWLALLDAHRPEARSILDGVLADRIRFEPDARRRRYRLTVPIAFDRILTGVVPELQGKLQERWRTKVGSWGSPLSSSASPREIVTFRVDFYWPRLRDVVVPLK